MAPDTRTGTQARHDDANGPLPEASTRSQPAARADTTVIPATPPQHAQPTAPARVSSVTGASDISGVPPAATSDVVPTTDRPAAATNGTPLPPPAHAMALTTYLKLAAEQVRAFKGMISEQQEGWARQLDTVEKQALLGTACQVIPMCTVAGLLGRL